MSTTIKIQINKFTNYNPNYILIIKTNKNQKLNISQFITKTNNLQTKPLKNPAPNKI